MISARRYFVLYSILYEVAHKYVKRGEKSRARETYTLYTCDCAAIFTRHTEFVLKATTSGYN